MSELPNSAEVKKSSELKGPAESQCPLESQMIWGFTTGWLVVNMRRRIGYMEMPLPSPQAEAKHLEEDLFLFSFAQESVIIWIRGGTCSPSCHPLVPTSWACKGFIFL